jgi:hypothetical protein
VNNRALVSKSDFREESENAAVRGCLRRKGLSSRGRAL